MKEAIVTGASGFIGSRIVYDLLKNGWLVYAIGRSKDNISWEKRMIASLDDIFGKSVERSLLENLQYYDIEITDPYLYEKSFFVNSFKTDNVILFHSAGDTRFTPSDPLVQRKINIDGSLNVIKAFGLYISSFVHISTAYVSGIRQNLIMENEFNTGQSFRNCYEESKLDGEIAIQKLCKELDIPLIITRPSIIINDTETGRSSTFTHLNALVDVISRLQTHYGLKPGEVFSKEIRIILDPECRPNMAPVDPIVNTLIKIAENPESIGKVFHLCNPAPYSNAEILNLLLKAFDIEGKIHLKSVKILTEPLTYTEKMILRSFKPYIPYLNDKSTFDLTNTRAIIPEYDSYFKPLGVEYMKKVINFQNTKSYNESL